MADGPATRSRTDARGRGIGPRRRSTDSGAQRVGPRRSQESGAQSSVRRSSQPSAERSYFASPASDQKAIRPGAPPGGKPPELGEAPFDWVGRHAPERIPDLHAHQFFTGTTVIGQVGKDDGLTGVRCMACVLENGQVWVGEREGCFSVWDAKTGRRLMRSTKKKDLFVWSILGVVAPGVVWVGYSDGYIRTFDAEGITLRAEMKEHVGGVYCLAGTGDNGLIFSGSSDFHIGKWDGPTATRIGQFTGHKNAVRALLVVGERLFSGSDDNTVRAWDIVSGASLSIWSDHTGGVHALEFVLGRYVWSASEDKTIRVWEVGDPAAGSTAPTGTCVRLLDSPHTGQINCLMLVGSLIWSSSWNQVFVWDPITYELKYSHREHEGVINALVPAHQSVVTRVWSAGNDGVIKFWNSECPWHSAFRAATDGRLQEVRLHLAAARQEGVDTAARLEAAEQRCKDLEADRQQAEHFLQAERAKAGEERRGLERHVQDARAQLADLAGRQPHAADGVEPELLAALIAAQKGDPNGAQRLRRYLDEGCPAWKLSAAAPVVPVEWLDTTGSGPEAEQRVRLRSAFVDGLLTGPLGEVPLRVRLDVDASEAFERGRSAAAIFPPPYAAQVQGGADSARRAGQRQAFARGLTEPFAAPPAEYCGSDPSAALLRGAFLKGRAAAHHIPSRYLDKPAQGAEEREQLREQREAFLKGLASESGKVPVEYQGGAARAGGAQQEALRRAFAEGHQLAPEVPQEYTAPGAGATPQQRRLREGLRAAYHGGMAAPGAQPPQETALWAADSGQLSQEQRAERQQLRDAWARGAAAALRPPAPAAPAQRGGATADPQAAIRAAFDAGLSGAQMPAGYAPDPSLPAAEQQRRSGLRDMYLQGQALRPLVGTAGEKPAAQASQVAALQDECRKLRERAAARTAELEEEAAGLRKQVAELEAQLQAAKELQGMDDKRGGHVIDPATLGDQDRAFVEGLARRQGSGSTRRTVGPRTSQRSAPGGSFASVDIAGAGSVDPSQLSEGERRRLFDLLGREGSDAAIGTPSLDAAGPPPLAAELGASTLLSEAAAEALRDPGLPPEARGLLGEAVVPQQGAAEEAAHAVLGSSVTLPEDTREELSRSIADADASRAAAAAAALRAALADPALPADVRKALQAALDSKAAERLGNGAWADRMAAAARQALARGNLPPAARAALSELVAGDPGGAAADAVRRAALDPAAPADVRASLGDAAADAGRGSAVPEAVREVLASGEQIPEPHHGQLQRTLRAYDARDGELREALRSAGGAAAGLPDQGLGPRELPAAARALQLSITEQNPAAAAAIAQALAVHRGRGNAVEDAARAAAAASEVPPTARRRLRAALGGGGADLPLLCDAVRGVLRPATHGIPPAHAAALRAGLAAAEGGAGGGLAEAARAALADTRFPQEARRQLQDAIAGHEGAAAELRIAAREGVRSNERGNAALVRAVDAAGVVAASRRRELERAADAAARDGRTPPQVADALEDALTALQSRGPTAARTVRGLLPECTQLPQPLKELLAAACDAAESGHPMSRSQSLGASLSRIGAGSARGSGSGGADPTDDLCDAVRLALRSPASELPSAPRRALMNAVTRADDAAASVRDAVRRGLRAADLPADIRGPLAAALGAADSEAAEYAAALRTALLDPAVSPAGRAALHGALRVAGERGAELGEAVRAAGQDGRVPPDVRRGLTEAAAAAAGRRVQLVAAAEKAAADSAVPEAARAALRTALGYDGPELVQVSLDAIAGHSGAPAARQALEHALDTHAARGAELREALRGVGPQLGAGDAAAAQRAGQKYDGAAAQLRAALQEAAADSAVPQSLRDEISGLRGGGTAEQCMRLARKAVQSSALPEGHRRALQQAALGLDEAAAGVAEAAQQAAESAAGGGPDAAAAARKLRNALAARGAAASDLAAAARGAGAGEHAAGADPEWRRVLAAAAGSEEQDDRLADAAREALRQRGPAGAAAAPWRARLGAALAKSDGRAEELREALREAAAEPGLSDVGRGALNEAAAGGSFGDVAARAQAALDAGLIPDGAVRDRVQEALDTAHGRARELGEAADAALRDPALPEEARRRLAAAAGHRPSASGARQEAALRAAIADPALPPEVKRNLEAALASEAAATPRASGAAEVPGQRGSGGEQGARDGQADSDAVLSARRLQDTRAELMLTESRLRDERQGREQAEAAAQRLRELVGRLGGEDRARRLAEEGDALQRLQKEARAAEQRAREAGERAEAAGKSEHAPPGASARERERLAALDAAYRSGRDAPAGAAVPAEVAAAGQPARDAWLRGRQEASGSIVPPEYADAPGLSAAEQARRRALRGAFYGGLSGGAVPHSGPAGCCSPEELEAAAAAGRAARDKELEWLASAAGARGLGAAAEAEAAAASRAALDAALCGSNTPAQAGGGGAAARRAAHRGQWLRADVLGDEAFGDEARGGDSSRGGVVPRRGSVSGDPGLGARRGSVASATGIDAVVGDRSRAAELLARVEEQDRELSEWRAAAEPQLLQEMGMDTAAPEFLTEVQGRLRGLEAEVEAAKGQAAAERERMAAKEAQLEASIKANLTHMQKERSTEMDKLKGLIQQLEQEINAKNQYAAGLSKQMAQLHADLAQDQMAEDAQLREIAERVRAGTATPDELLRYYKDRERKWAELGTLARELQEENKSLLTESVALAQRLRALSFVFESRPALVKSLHELYKMCSVIPGQLGHWNKEAQARQFSRLEMTNKISELNGEVELIKDGARWIIANLFTAYELHHLGTSPSLFVPDKRRPTWRDIQVPARHRELLLSTWQDTDLEHSPAGSPVERRSSTAHSPPRGSHASPVRTSGSAPRRTVGSDLPRVMPAAAAALQRRASQPLGDESPTRSLPGSPVPGAAKPGAYRSSAHNSSPGPDSSGHRRMPQPRR